MKRVQILIGIVAMLVLATSAVAGERCGGRGKGHHGKRVLLGTDISVVNTSDGADVTVTARDAEKADAVKAHFAQVVERKAKGLGCPSGMEGRPGPGGPDCKCGAGKGECKCGPDCKCGAGKGECKCGPDCKCGAGKGECKCGKGDGCGCGGPGGCHGDPGGKPKLCSLISADDVSFAVEQFELGVVLSVTSTNPEKVTEIQGTLAKLAEFINNFKPGEGCGCQGK